MKKKNLQPQQTAPVKRNNTAATCPRTSPQGVQAAFEYLGFPHPFAGDDAE